MRLVYLVGLLVMGVACTPAQAPASDRTRPADTPASSAPQRTLNMSLRTEVTDLMPKIPGNSNPSLTKRIFNAAVALIDGNGSARAYLVEALTPFCPSDRPRLGSQQLTDESNLRLVCVHFIDSHDQINLLGAFTNSRSQACPAATGGHATT